MIIMKTTTFLPPASLFAIFGRAPDKRKIDLSIFCLIIVTLWNTNSVTAAPAKLDSFDSTFPLDLQPPIYEATIAASSPSQHNGDKDGTTIDSYGNPIESLQPIQTPDGRKVVSAQGLQFEIPNYASGITELKKPADDLLPPFVDPIVVALSNESQESFSTKPGPSSSDETTSVDVESVPLVEVKSHTDETHSSTAALLKDLPDYILELNDPDIGGPVDYEPSKENRGLNVITWDLLPPLEIEHTTDKSISHSNKDHSLNGQSSPESSHTTQKPRFSFTSSLGTTTKPNYTQNRGGVFYTSTIARSTTARTTTPTTITKSRTTTNARTTTTPRRTATTTRRTTTPRTTATTTTSTTTTTTTTTPEPNSEESFQLEAGDSYTLPTWLQDIDDPDLDVAVAFIVPEDINEYNHTVERDLEPPLEPYTDLNNLHFTSPPSDKEATTTTSRTTTTNTPNTTTTKRPALSTAQPHWVRAKPTSPKSTTSKYRNQFTSLSPSISSNYFAQRTTSTKTTTTAKPRPFTNFNNRPLSSNTPQTDKIGSSDEEANIKSLENEKYKPQSTTRRTTTTTTTTTTVAPEIIEKNPFEPTLPPWLKDFDYPDLAPGVPFIYDPNEDENPVNKNILPPSITDETNKTNLPSNSNSQTPQGFTNKFTFSTIPLTSSSSIPSIVTIPLPSTQTNQADTKLMRPPLVFVPPRPNSAEAFNTADMSDDIPKKISSSFNKNFAAPFNTATASGQNNLPPVANSDSFPPLNNNNTGSSTIPSKTTFTKSEEGKVITNNIFLSGSGSTSAKPIAAIQNVNDQDRTALTTKSSNGTTFTKSTTSSSAFKQFGATSPTASGFVTASGLTSPTLGSSSNTDGSKYTGRFGGPPGVLAPQQAAFTSSSTAVTKSHNKPAFTTTSSVTSSTGLAANNNNDKFTGSFGGPPGVLKPYDNVKNR